MKCQEYYLKLAKMVIVKNKIVNIFGEPWSWKTLMLAFLSYFYLLQWGSVYSNFDIKINWVKKNKDIKNLYDIKKIKFKEKKQWVILDEAWKLLNSRESMNNINEKSDIIDLAFLGRKKNADIFLGAQLDYSIDKYFRDLWKYNFYMDSFFVKKDYLKFKVNMYWRGAKDKWYFLWEREIDLFRFLSYCKVEYDTFSTSEVKNDKNSKKQYEKRKVIKSIDIKESKELIEDIKKNMVFG